MNLLQSCVAAFRFLTIFPWPGKFGAEPEDLKDALGFFPFVGIVLGGIALLFTWILWGLFPPFAAAVLVTFLLLSFSGALHLDGLADCADGFFSSRDQSRMLEIMRDSRIGVMGVIAVVMVLLLKISVLSGLERSQAALAVLLMPVAGRFALVLMIFLLPYARKEGGLATLFYDSLNAWSLYISLALFLGISYGVFRLPGIMAALGVIFGIFLFSRLCLKKIGGATGDTLGAACELSETFSLLLFSFC